jgi:hypothetical protein
MAKIVRKTQKIFGSAAGATGITKYGTPAGGTSEFSTDLDEIQTADWLTGWAAAALAGDEIPTLQDFNAIHFVATTQIAYILQEGIPEYDTGTEYHVNSIVKKTASYELYGSKVTPNLGNALPAQVDDANWQYLGKISDLVNIGALTGGTTGNVLAYDGGGAAVDTDLGSLTPDISSEWEFSAAPHMSDTPPAPPLANRLYNDSIVKGWINLNGTGVIAIRDSYNVSSIVDNGVGAYTINWDLDFANINYSVAGLPSDNGVSAVTMYLNNTTPPVVGAAKMQVATVAGAAVDSAHVHVMAIGDQ